MAALLGSGLAQAQGPSLRILNPWMRALPNHLPAAGYFTLMNQGLAPVQLIGAASPACGQLMLHRTVTAGGTARMETVKSVAVPAKGSLSFAPGGYHLMCMAPSADVQPGKVISVTLGFAGGATLQAEFSVRNAAGK